MLSGDVLSSMEMIHDSARGITGQDLTRIRKLRFTLPGFDRSVWEGDLCARLARAARWSPLAIWISVMAEFSRTSSTFLWPPPIF
ncbi:MAG: hypothetical protein PHE83_17490 [Opitutaceae bacterium]|nr:hypothetical protein [Opitutaceae bacterium]